MATDTLARVFKRLLTREKGEQLDLEGYVVLDDNPLPAAMAAEFLKEVKHCFHSIDGGKVPNEVEFLTKEGAVKLTKPHIYECDLYNEKIRKQLPLFDDLFNSQLADLVDVLRDGAACCEDLVEFSESKSAAKSVTLKLQMNEGGAFPWHYDNPSRPNKRRLTMAVYLTEGWEEAMGGEIQLMPFLGKCVSVPPRLNTVVLFRSDMVLHKVVPINPHSGKTRYCFTVWFDGYLTNSDEDQFLRASQLCEEAIPFLMRSPVQRTLARAVYEQEFRDGLADCFGVHSMEYQMSIKEHEAHLAQLRSNPKVNEFIQTLILYRQDTRP